MLSQGELDWLWRDSSLKGCRSEVGAAVRGGVPLRAEPAQLVFQRMMTRSGSRREVESPPDPSLEFGCFILQR